MRLPYFLRTCFILTSHFFKYQLRYVITETASYVMLIMTYDKKIYHGPAVAVLPHAPTTCYAKGVITVPRGLYREVRFYLKRLVT